MDQQFSNELAARVLEIIRSKLEQSDAYPLNPDDTQHLQHLEKLYESVLNELDIVLPRSQKRRLFERVAGEVVGYGPLEPLFADETISEIIVLGPRRVYVKRGHKRELAASTFHDNAHLERIINRILGHELSLSSPLGHKRRAAYQTTAVNGYTVSNTGSALVIRKRTRWEHPTAEELIEAGTLTLEQLQYLQSCVQTKLNIVISGDIATGKTALLNILVGFIPNEEFIVVVEEQYREDLVALSQDVVICLHSRPEGIRDLPPMTVTELIAHALKMRPERLVIGELRAGEILAPVNADYTKWLATACVASVNDINPQLAPTTDVIVHMRYTQDETYQIADIFRVVGINERGFMLESWQ